MAISKYLKEYNLKHFGKIRSRKTWWQRAKRDRERLLKIKKKVNELAILVRSLKVEK